MSPADLNRRALVSGAACMVAASPALAASRGPYRPEWPIAEGVDTRLSELWRKRRAAIAAAHGASAKASAAEARLPAWARSGPQYITSEGAPYGDSTVGWPAIEMSAADLRTLPSEGLTLLRPSPATIERDYERNLHILGPRGAGKRRTQALAALSRRLRDQTAEEKKLGLPNLERAADAAWEKQRDIEDEIKRLSPSTPHLIAALTLMEIAYCGDDKLEFPKDGTLQLAELVLLSLRPHLIGPLGEAVGEFLDNPSKSVSEMSFSPNSAPRALPAA